MVSIDGARLAEAGAVAALGGVLSLGVAVGLDGMVGVPAWLVVTIAIVGIANGLVSGLRGIYDWSSGDGFVGLLLDSTWSLVMTVTGLFAHVVALVTPRAGYLPELSQRRGAHVYRRGFTPRDGFAITLGNVISGAADVERESRRKLIAEHEMVHVWQARWLGPIYPVLYVLWSLFGAIYGIIRWGSGARKRGAFGRVVETYSYYCNPIEWWAYSRDGRWRPRQMVAGCGWTKPAVAPRPRHSGDRDGPDAGPSAAASDLDPSD